MGQAESEISIGEILGELGIQTPQAPENQTPAPEPQESTDAEANEETDITPESDAEAQADAEDSDDNDATEETEESAAEESEDSDEEEAPAEVEDKSVKKLNKRVDKLTARAKSAEEQAAALQNELAQAKEALAKAQPIVLQDAADPLADVQSPADLDSRLASANTVIDQVPDLIAKAEMEGGEIEVPMGNGSVQKFTTAQLRERLQLAKGIVRNEPTRRAYFAQRETFVAEAKTAYPEIFQEGSELRQVLTQTLRQYPALARLPNLEMIVGDAMLGQQVRFGSLKVLPTAPAKSEAKAKPAASAASKPVVAPKVPQPSAAPRSKAKPNALDALKKSGSREAAESFVAALLDE